MCITCIVPCYNENRTLPYVLTQLSQIPSLNQVIVVDDHSSLSPADIVSSSPKAQLLSHTSNLGKYQSLLTGLRHASNSHILLCDADLTTLNLSDFRRAIELYFVNSLDMLILRRTPEPLLNHLFKANLMLSGIRLISSKLLKQALVENMGRYSSEITINSYMLNHHHKIAQIKVRYHDLHKIIKLGFIAGLSREVQMYSELIQHPDYWQQLLSFSPPECN